MRRRPFTVASALSLLLCLASVVLWIEGERSDFGLASLRRSHTTYELLSINADLVFTMRDDSSLLFQWVHGFRGCLIAGHGTGGFSLFVAHGYLAGLFAILPSVYVLRGWWRARHRVRPGDCGACGYNLTGNASGTCPECGAAVDVRSAPAAPPSH